MYNYDFPEKEPSAYDLIEPGYYAVQIENVEERETQRGARMLTCTYRILSKIEHGQFLKHPANLIFHNIVFPLDYDEPDKAAFMLDRISNFLKIIGEPYKGKIAINPANWPGKELAIKVRHQEWNGDTQHAVHYVLKKEKALEITSQQTPDQSRVQTCRDTEPRVPNPVPGTFSTQTGDQENETDINDEDIPF